MGGKRTFDFDRAIGKATWIPGFVAFAVFAGIVGVSAYSSLSSQISADPAATTQATTAKVAGSDCGATIDKDASGKPTASGYIRVAINNYWVPSGLASADQHKAYNEKTSNALYKCNEISVKVPNAVKCLTDEQNMAAIKTAVTDKYKLGYTDSTKEFGALTGDQMKKTIIGSSIKPKCLGGSESYEGLTDDRQATDSKTVETAKGAAEGVLSGGEDIKVLTPKANPAVEKQVAQGQEAGGGSSRKSSESSSGASSSPDNSNDTKSSLDKCRSDVNGYLSLKANDKTAVIEKIRNLYSGSKVLVYTKKTQLSKCQEALKLINEYKSQSNKTNPPAKEKADATSQDSITNYSQPGAYVYKGTGTKLGTIRAKFAQGGLASLVRDAQGKVWWSADFQNPDKTQGGSRRFMAPVTVRSDGSYYTSGNWQMKDPKPKVRYLHIDSKGSTDRIFEYEKR